jgi:hypothetical protein
MYQVKIFFNYLVPVTSTTPTGELEKIGNMVHQLEFQELPKLLSMEYFLKITQLMSKVGIIFLLIFFKDLKNNTQKFSNNFCIDY